MADSERVLTSVIYGCHDCDWPPGPGEGKNGVGLAAQHAEKTGHETWADETWSRMWNSDADERMKGEEGDG